MGYELDIVRQKDYDDTEADSTISLEEWTDYVVSDKELELTNGFEIIIPEGLPVTDWQESPGFCEWIGHPAADAGTIPWFDFHVGSISTKYPDRHTIGKMIKIAKALQAKVRGDDGEYWNDTFFTNGGYATDLEHRI